MNNVFWNYLKNVLKWSLLQNSALGVIVKGAAGYFERISEDIVYVRDQFLIQKSENIDGHADSRGIRRLPMDSNSQYRVRVENAYRWQKYVAREKGLPVILKDYGFSGAEIRNIKDNEGYADKDRWAEFEVVFEGYGQDISIVPIINEYKPVRSKLSLVLTPAFTEGIYSITGYARIQDAITSIKAAPTARVTMAGYVTINDYITSIKGE